jgi:chitinase
MKTIKYFLVACTGTLLMFMASCKKDSSNPEPSKKIALGGSRNLVANVSSFKVIGYLPSWAGDVTQVQYSKLTHINYAFLLPTSSGGYEAIDDPSKLSSMVTLAHAAGTKAMISVGGGGGGDGFAGIVASSANITTFVNNMISFTNQYNLDGVDIDWEYPSTGTQANNFLTMMQQLATALHNKGKLLSIAVIGEDGDYVVSGMFSTVDFLNIMAYDDNNFQHSTFDLGADCLAYWLGRGVPAAKAILGVPFYGHDSSKSEDDADDQVNYNTILADGGDPNMDVYGTIGYNGILTMKSKTSYAMTNAGGLTIWDLSGDATGSNSLLTAINQTIAAGGVLPTNAPVGTIVTLKGFNNEYVSGENGTTAMTCTRTTASTWEQFMVVNAGYGMVALQSMSKYVSSEDGLQSITCNRTSYSTWEMFSWITTSDGKVTLRGTNDDFISSEDGTIAMTCNRPVASGWEAFGVNQ